MAVLIGLMIYEFMWRVIYLPFNMINDTKPGLIYEQNFALHIFLLRLLLRFKAEYRFLNAHLIWPLS